MRRVSFVLGAVLVVVLAACGGEKAKAPVAPKAPVDAGVPPPVTTRAVPSSAARARWARPLPGVRPTIVPRA